jgi:hypothetical protein
MKSFLFTLKNPQGVPRMKFMLKSEKNDRATSQLSLCGPDFYDIGVCDHSSDYPRSRSPDFGIPSLSDTGLDGRCLLMGSELFTVEEIEVFEIPD